MWVCVALMPERSLCTIMAWSESWITFVYAVLVGANEIDKTTAHLTIYMFENDFSPDNSDILGLLLVHNNVNYELIACHSDEWRKTSRFWLEPHIIRLNRNTPHTWLAPILLAAICMLADYMPANQTHWHWQWPMDGENCLPGFQGRQWWDEGWQKI